MVRPANWSIWRLGAQRAVDKYPGARFKSFATRAEAGQTFAHSNPKKSAITRRSDSRASHTAHRFDVSIYCDGACNPDPAMPVRASSSIEAASSQNCGTACTILSGTNNTAELNALYHALRMAEEEIKNGKTVEVCSDSAYAINCIRSWAPSGKETVKNRAARSKTLKLSRTLTQFTGASKTRSHSPMLRDTLARRAMSSPIAWPCMPRKPKKKELACSRTGARPTLLEDADG